MADPSTTPGGTNPVPKSFERGDLLLASDMNDIWAQIKHSAKFQAGHAGISSGIGNKTARLNRFWHSAQVLELPTGDAGCPSGETVTGFDCYLPIIKIRHAVFEIDECVGADTSAARFATLTTHVGSDIDDALCSDKLRNDLSVGDTVLIINTSGHWVVFAVLCQAGSGGGDCGTIVRFEILSVDETCEFVNAEVKNVCCGLTTPKVGDEIEVYDRLECRFNVPYQSLIGLQGYASFMENDEDDYGACRWEVIDLCCSDD